jgi:hypothetical protein
VLLALSFVAFLARYPKQDGDNIKALYLLNAAPVVALACAVGLTTLAGSGRGRRTAAVAASVAAGLVTLGFLVLPPD